MNSPYRPGMRRLWLTSVLGIFLPTLGMRRLSAQITAFLAVNMRLLAYLAIMSGTASSAYAIDAPPPTCAVVNVTDRQVTISARFFKRDGTVAPLTLVDEKGVKHLGTAKFTLPKGAYRLNLPPGANYEEVRVRTKNETPPVLYRPVCVDVVLQ